MGYRVFQWASGSVGRHAARACLERDGLELVGLHAFSPEKIGRDVGEILRRDPLGIPVTGDVEAILASTADVVVHAPVPSRIEGDDPDRDLKDICRLLAGGKNVITLVGYLYPKAHGEALVRRLEDACREGGASFHSTGLNPGWIGDLLPLLLSALSRRIDHVHVQEITSFEGYPSPELMFDSMGFGASEDAFHAGNRRRLDWLDSLFYEAMQMTADGMGLDVDGRERSLEVALAPEDLETAAGTVRKGTVAGQRYRWSGLRAGEEVIASETVWRMHEAVAPDWPRGDHKVTLEGRPRMELAFPHAFCSDWLLATAMHAVNAIPAVCDASPGIRTPLDLPWISPAR